jgi:hypothetical protein
MYGVLEYHPDFSFATRLNWFLDVPALFGENICARVKAILFAIVAAAARFAITLEESLLAQLW